MSEHTRTAAEEQMVGFGYYLAIAANLLTDEQVEGLITHEYEDPRDVLREASEWCYGPGRTLPARRPTMADDGVRVPTRILVECRAPRPGAVWLMEVQAQDGTVLDYTFANTRWSAWQMAKSSFRQLRKKANSASEETDRG